ncbi:hypothetical protein ACFE04_002310 [Oxalis oulophora]
MRNNHRGHGSAGSTSIVSQDIEGSDDKVEAFDVENPLTRRKSRSAERALKLRRCLTAKKLNARLDFEEAKTSLADHRCSLCSNLGETRDMVEHGDDAMTYGWRDHGMSSKEVKPRSRPPRSKAEAGIRARLMKPFVTARHRDGPRISD